MIPIEQRGNTALVETDVAYPITGNLNAKQIAVYYDGKYINLSFKGLPGEAGEIELEPVVTSWYADLQAPIAAEVRKGDQVVTVLFDTLSNHNQTPGHPEYGSWHYIYAVQFSLSTGIETGRYNVKTKRFEDSLPTSEIYSGLRDKFSAQYITGTIPGYEDYNNLYRQVLAELKDVLDPSSASSGTGSSSSTSSDPVIHAFTPSIDRLTGAKKQKDLFRFDSAPGFGSQSDQITGFSVKDKDALSISRTSFGVEGSSFAIAKKPKDLKRLLASDADFIYNQKKGELIFNSNGPDPGFGDDGGVFALLVGSPKLVASSVSFI